VPYLKAPPAEVQKWNARLRNETRPCVGLAWSGRSVHRNDHNRSIALRALLPLLRARVTFVSLQKDVRPDDAQVLKEYEGILDYTEALKDFSDTAALVANLDLVISADTSVVHLAGALSKPVWVLLPFSPDWRWLLDREDSPWYPTARLFRQDVTRAWDKVVTRVHAALEGLVDAIDSTEASDLAHIQYE
jgi:ADP-heptose:LPS heptosyltransferase